MQCIKLHIKKSDEDDGADEAVEYQIMTQRITEKMIMDRQIPIHETHKILRRSFRMIVVCHPERQRRILIEGSFLICISGLTTTD